MADDKLDQNDKTEVFGHSDSLIVDGDLQVGHFHSLQYPLQWY